MTFVKLAATFRCRDHLQQHVFKEPSGRDFEEAQKNGWDSSYSDKLFQSECNKIYAIIKR